MKQRRTIAVVTGSRADFGLLEPVIRAMSSRRTLGVRVIVAGAHLVSGTWRDVAAAGFTIAARVPMQRRGKVGFAADVAAMGRGIVGLGGAFERIKPDVVLVLGDRIEAMATACAASVGGVLLAHIHGGDRAEGVADEAMRHAVSKLAHLHFAATALSRERLIRMGEPAGSVWDVGSPAVDGLRGIRPRRVASVVVVQHPIGASDAQEQRWMRQTLAALRGRDVIVGAPNTDPGCAGVRRALSGQPVFEHLPRREFAAMLKGADVIVGNSSAGLIEAAVLGVPCVNVGPRQGGRERPASVIDCDYGEASVRNAVRKALGMRKRFSHPYGDGRTGQRIASILSRVSLHPSMLRKHNAY